LVLVLGVIGAGKGAWQKGLRPLFSLTMHAITWFRGLNRIFFISGFNIHHNKSWLTDYLVIIKI